MNKIGRWTLHKQMLSSPSQNVEDVLERIVAVYSTNPSGPLSLLARTVNLKPRDLFELEANKMISRIPCMRTSVHTVLTSNVEKIFTSSLPDPNTGYWAKQYEVKGKNLMDKDYQRWYPFIIQFAKTPKSLIELKDNLDIPGEMMKFIVNRMAFEGKLLRIGAESVTSNLINYVSSDNWISRDLYNNKREDSLNWLAHSYLRGFGPARVRDFQWWSGCNVKEAKSSFESLQTHEIEGDLHILSDELETFNRFTTNELTSIHILPQWDSYTMGYAPDGRERLVAKEHLKQVYGAIGATGGNAFGVIISNDMVRAVWKPKFTRKELIVKIEVLDHDILDNEMLEEEFMRVAHFMGSEKVDLQFK